MGGLGGPPNPLAEALKAAVKAGKAPEDALEVEGSLKVGFDFVTASFQNQFEDDERVAAAGTAAQRTESKGSVPPPPVVVPPVPEAVLAFIGDEPTRTMTIADEAMEAIETAELQARRLIDAHVVLDILPTSEKL